LRYRAGARHACRDGVALTAWGIPGPSSNKAAVLGPAPPLARVRGLADEFFAGVEGGYGIMVEADAGHPLEQELRQAGWRVAEDEPALVLPELPPPAPLPPGLGVRRVTDEATRRDFIRALAAGFGAPTADADFGVPLEALDDLAPPLTASHDPDVALLVGYCEGRPASTSILHKVEEVATITGVATPPAFRRRGFGRALTGAAVRAGAERGCACAALNALGASYPMYLGMGFRHVCNHRTYVPPGHTAGGSVSP
jgi:GNAT superfamily N-acetyltransferase